MVETGLPDDEHERDQAVDRQRPPARPQHRDQHRDHGRDQDEHHAHRDPAVTGVQRAGDELPGRPAVVERGAPAGGLDREPGVPVRRPGRRPTGCTPGRTPARPLRPPPAVTRSRAVACRSSTRMSAATAERDRERGTGRAGQAGRDAEHAGGDPGAPVGGEQRRRRPARRRATRCSPSTARPTSAARRRARPARTRPGADAPRSPNRPAAARSRPSGGQQHRGGRGGEPRDRERGRAVAQAEVMTGPDQRRVEREEREAVAGHGAAAS